MNIERTIQHSVYHRGFETHSPWSPKTINEFELLLKTSALFSRSIVVPDSDLNNHPLLSKLLISKKSNSFASAISSGFIRRAARYKDEPSEKGVLSQQEIYERFKSNSPDLAAKIKPIHPQTLDTLFDGQEAKNDPLMWKVEDAASLFADRMLAAFKGEKLSREGRGLAAQIEEKFIIELRSRGRIKELSGGKIASKLLRQRRENPAQKAIWSILQRSYNGNLLGAFQGKLSVVQSRNDRGRIPGGPLPNTREDEFTRDFYFNAKSHRSKYGLIVVHHPQNLTTHPGFVLDIQKLLDLRFEEIEELRETASPTSYFNARFKALGNEASYVENKNWLHEGRISYWERLDKAGLILNKREPRKTMNDILELFVETRLDEDEQDLRYAEGKLGLNLALVWVPGSNLLIGIDAVEILKRNDEINQARNQYGALYQDLRNTGRFIFQNAVLKRPDFEVIRRIGDNQ